MTSTDRRRASVLVSAAIAAALLAGPGCGSADPYERLAIEGSVSLDGQPLPTGTISFVPQQQGAASSTEIADGRFRLRRAEGLSPGSYRVEVYRFAETGRMVPSLDDPDELMPETANVVPEQYNIRSQLTVDISEDSASRPLEFALTTGTAGN